MHEIQLIRVRILETGVVVKVCPVLSTTMASCLFRNSVRAALTRGLRSVEVLSCYSTATEASSDEFKMKYLDDGTETFSKMCICSI